MEQGKYKDAVLLNDLWAAGRAHRAVVGETFA
jgi:hypothetical protein